MENWLRSGPEGLTPYLRDGWRVWQGSGWYLAPTTRLSVEGEGHFQSEGFCGASPLRAPAGLN